MSTKTPATRRGPKIRLKTALPVTFLMEFSKCSERHARRRLSDGTAPLPPWEIVESMIEAARMAGAGDFTAEEILAGFAQAVQEWMQPDK
jgi:hypothetical protein